MSPDASDLLSWLAARGGSALQRDIGDTAPRRFRRASVYGPLVTELLAAGAIIETATRPRTLRVVEASTPAEAADDVVPVPAEPQAEPQRESPPSPRPAPARAVTVRRPTDAEIRAAVRQAFNGRRHEIGEAAAIVEAASNLRAELIAEARAAAGLACSCPTCGAASAMVDRAIVEALR